MALSFPFKVFLRKWPNEDWAISLKEAKVFESGPMKIGPYLSKWLNKIGTYLQKRPDEYHARSLEEA
jgi:hypothetical protein